MKSGGLLEDRFIRCSFMLFIMGPGFTWCPRRIFS